MSYKEAISIVIPVYNGEKSITNLVEHLIDTLSISYHLEIVLVNDCSPDSSEAVCVSIFEKHKNIVKFLSLSKNVGEHNAVMAGLNNITGDFTVIMDDDFQNPVSEVIKLIEFAIQSQNDVVYTYYDKKEHSFFRNLGSRFNDKMATVLLKKPKDLYLSSFKIINKFLVKEIVKYNLPFPYIDGLILRTTNNIGKLKVKHNKRTNGASNYTLKKLVSLWMNMFTNFSILPLRFSMIIGFTFSLFGFGYGLFSIIEKLYNPNLPTGYAALIVLVSVFSGIQLMALGMIGEYLGRMFMSQNKKPQYSIRKMYTI
ncbi:glycosyltransferase family 2 protein [Flavivirga spongiicola]|uniref:Glycosyltransferase family 2 protein n=1 Tax=Flavivirga spongiicola TaxID=421621 RepID=A0ABU7XP54_9FLAO|nr:glycosyltransferase family 2 protein [Flavivirga sp. MEBiC05379]MDO5977541.1 glycosyltransferase family 2 protein [Flavivirga sp. MEBiC05379]